mmetsp:Transcript_13611/g.31273  ORF Transcript_13611/g.31273 Transcript_13611/m.31273 type:complete len:201 (-) Transcript_13611:27-629(-)
MLIAENHCTIQRAFRCRRLKQWHSLLFGEIDLGVVVQESQRVGIVQEAQQRERVWLPSFGGARDPVNAPRQVALGRALLAKEEHGAERGHRERILLGLGCVEHRHGSARRVLAALHLPQASDEPRERAPPRDCIRFVALCISLALHVSLACLRCLVSCCAGCVDPLLEGEGQRRRQQLLDFGRVRSGRANERARRGDAAN